MSSTTSRELAKYADVYYLADREMPESELAKLDGVTMGAWGVRHGQYDFGSYARLADLVGWNTIEQYDELLLVNDSCYLLRPLDDVFSRMDGKSCHWWGLQATKGIYQTRREPANQFREPISMESVRSVLVDRFEQDYVYDFLVGSFFVAYRKPVIDDPEFRRYLCSVATEPTKRHIVKKYEIGLTRWLIQHGHSFDTYMSRSVPFPSRLHQVVLPHGRRRVPRAQTLLPVRQPLPSAGIGGVAEADHRPGSCSSSRRLRTQPREGHRPRQAARQPRHR